MQLQSTQMVAEEKAKVVMFRKWKKLLDPSTLALTVLPKINEVFSPWPLSPDDFLGKKKEVGWKKIKIKKKSLLHSVICEILLNGKLNQNKIWTAYSGEAGKKKVGCWTLFLKFTIQAFLNNAASESTAFIRARKHNLNGQAENGWIKLFFPSL